jgi:phosphoribosylamine--glycine ligase
MNCHGDPYVIEYNVRLGDPETEVILPRLKGDIMDLFIAVAEKKLDRISVEIDSRTAVTVIMASGGYPGHYEKGKIIDHLDKTSGSLVFHAGTKREGDQILTNGGRVLAISSLNRDFRQALKVSYDNAALIEFDKKYYRTDIGFDL